MIYIVASDWSKPLFDQTQGRNKPIRSDYIYPCDSAEFETIYRGLIRRRLKPLYDTNKPAAAQATTSVCFLTVQLLDYFVSQSVHFLRWHLKSRLEHTFCFGYFQICISQFLNYILIKKWSMLGMRLSSYECTREVGRTRVELL